MEGVLWRPISGLYSGNDRCSMTNGIGHFSNNDHLHYYNNIYGSRSRYLRGITCSAVMEKGRAYLAMVDDRKNNKMMKKKHKEMMKLLKGLSGDLAMLLSGELASLDTPFNQEWKDASEALRSQLKKLKSEQKELKRKMKEEMAKYRVTDCSKKMKEEKAKTKATDCTSTSSSSSESSDNECEREVLDMSRLKHDTNVPPPSSATLNGEDLQLQLPQITLEEEEPALASLTNALNQDSHNILLSLLGEEQEATEKKNKIEVCMGGKCKRSGAVALLEEFQKVAGAGNADVDVVGCKCMGKCRDGPNVRLISPPAIDGFDHDDELLRHCQVAVAGATVDPPSVMKRWGPRPSYPLCIGVGLDKVSFIVSKFVGNRAGLV